MQQILVATDPSRSGPTAVEFAADLAAEHDAALNIVHVRPLIEHMPVVTGDDEDFAVPYEPRSRDHELLADAKVEAAKRGLTTTTDLLFGTPAVEIAARGDQLDVDLIVVGSRGHGLFGSAVLGSVSLGVLRTAKRPVVIVRGGDIWRERPDQSRAR